MCRSVIMPADNDTTHDESLIAAYENHVNPAMVSVMKFMGFETVEDHARGCLVTDTRGDTFLDCLGGVGTLSLGYSHPRVVAAVKAQLDKMAFSSRMLFNGPQARLAQKLAEIAPGDLQYCFFCNSGTEAAEAAIKIARKKTGRTRLVSTEAGFHGKTFGALSVSGRDKYKTPFLPLVPDCVQVPYNDVAALEAALDESVAAFLVEPIQGEGGINVPDDEYLRHARRLCDETGALLVFDEVQTGLGRTGKLWGCDWSGVAPDLMMLAKALSGGCVPIGVVLGTPEVWEIWRENPLIHTSTFGGNPLACVAGLATIEVVESENLVERSRVQGEKLFVALCAVQEKHPDYIKEVRGRGLMIGVEFSHEDIGGLVIGGLAQRKVLAAYTLNNPTVIRFEPPLVIDDEQIAWAVRAFEESVEQALELIVGLEDED
jgi:putrescine aminotransferase